MNANTRRAGKSTDGESTTNCDRCGRDRPHDPQRLTITFSDRTDATLQDERLFVCKECWSMLRDSGRRCFA
jgi:hypothetical protein